MKQSLYARQPRNTLGQFRSKRISNLRFFGGIALFFVLCAIAGGTKGFLDALNAPTPDIRPVQSMDDVKVFKPDYEAQIKSRTSEIWNGEKFVPSREFRLVTEAYAAEIPVERELEKTHSTGDIEQMITHTFGKDAKTALCIASAESGLNPNAENRGRAKAGYRGECSIGLFQINLKSNGCMGRAVHWAKAEGETLEEKVEWLKVPENNIKVAKQIFDASGWGPWSTKGKCI